MKNVIKSFSILMFLLGSVIQLSAEVPWFPGNTGSIVQECRVDFPGGAYLTFADKFGGGITKKELQSTTELGVAGCAEGSKIYEFKLEIRSGGETKKFRGNSHILTSEVLKNLRGLTRGDTFEFSEIKAYLPSGSKIDALGRKFTII